MALSSDGREKLTLSYFTSLATGFAFFHGKVAPAIESTGGWEDRKLGQLPPGKLWRMSHGGQLKLLTADPKLPSCLLSLPSLALLWFGYCIILYHRMSIHICNVYIYISSIFSFMCSMTDSMWTTSFSPVPKDFTNHTIRINHGLIWFSRKDDLWERIDK